MEYGLAAPVKQMRLVALPALLGLVWSASAASAQTCSLALLNSVPLTVTDNIASVPATIGGKEKQFQIDTAALDNQMGKDAVTDFGLGVTDFVPSDSGGGAAGFSSGSAAFTDPGGSNKSNTIPLGRFGAVGGDMGGNASPSTMTRAPCFTAGPMPNPSLWDRCSPTICNSWSPIFPNPEAAAF